MEGQGRGWLRRLGSEGGWQGNSTGEVGEECVGKLVVEGSGSVVEREFDGVVAGEEIVAVGLQGLKRSFGP